MNVLVACEESQRVTIEFRKLGHKAYSCDLLECSGNHPEWHIKKDVTLLLNGNCIFHTVDGVEHEISGKWDMIIAFPPCTYLTVTGNRWYNYEKYGYKAIQRMLDRNDAIKFFMRIANADCDKIAVENPVGIMSTQWRKPDQIIQPYQYGDAYEKRTCLWLKGLPRLLPTKIVEIPDRIQFKSGKTMAKWYVEAGNLSKEQRALVRSKTFPGIAKAMATQWGSEESIQSEEKHYADYTSEETVKDVMEVKQDLNTRFGKKVQQYFDTDCLELNNTIIAKIENINHCPNQNTCCIVSPFVHCNYNYKSDSCIKVHKNFIHDCESVHKQMKAINNPNWHTVRLATVNSSDFFRLNEKLKLYISTYRELKQTLSYLRKCKSINTYDSCYVRYIKKQNDMWAKGKFTNAMLNYIRAKLSMQNVESGIWKSGCENATGYHDSRRYNKSRIDL